MDVPQFVDCPYPTLRSVKQNTVNLANLKINLVKFTGTDDLSQFLYAGGAEIKYDMSKQFKTELWRKHWTYYTQFSKYHPNLVIPPLTNKCPCHHKITVNCWIYHPKTDQIIVIGDCCIERFMNHKLKRRCAKCSINFSKCGDERRLCKSCIAEEEKIVKKSRS